MPLLPGSLRFVVKTIFNVKARLTIARLEITINSRSRDAPTKCTRRRPDSRVRKCLGPTSTIALSGMSKGNSGRRFVDILFANGGLGARPNMDGVSSLGFPANISGVPVEVTENEKPLTFLYKELATDSGGPDRFRGRAVQR